MKTRDARAILNLKKQKNLQQKRNINVSNGRIVDARQILKLKRVAKTTKPNYQPIHGTSSLVKKQFNQILKRTVKSNTKYLIQNNKWSRGKHVQVSTGGNLRITSRGENQKKIDATEKQILSNRTGITITTPNKFPQRKSVHEEQMIEEEQDEDLERMTLDDLPEIKSMKTGILPSKSHSSWQSSNSQLSLSSRLQTPGNTMVADSVITPSSNQQGYSILVTNLHSSVTQEDIVELFGDVGSMMNAQLLQPGTALIVYFTKEEAMQACETYHNRLLDGQPMQCSLLQPNVSSVRSSLSSRLGGKLTPTSTRVSTPSTQVSTPISTRMSAPVQQTLPAISWPSSLHHEAKTLTSNNRSVQFTVRMP